MGISNKIRDRAIGILTSFFKENLDQELDSSAYAVTDNKAEYVNLRKSDLKLLISWLNTKVESGRASTHSAKCYRRWLASYFESLSDPCAHVIRNWVPPIVSKKILKEDKTEAMPLIDKKRDMSPAPEIEKSNVNSQCYLYLNKGVLKALLEVLTSEPNGEKRYKEGDAAALFFSMSMLTGLRPMEWPTARLRDMVHHPKQNLTIGPVLDVLTLTQQSRRDDNPLHERRYLVIDGWPPEQIKALKAFIRLIAEHADAPKAFYTRIRWTLRRAWIQVSSMHGQIFNHTGIFVNGDELGGTAGIATLLKATGSPPGVSLYTPRHIFAEEVRREGGLNRFELAALLGQSALTDQAYYGPRLANADREYTFALPRPWPGDADDIMEWDEIVNPRKKPAPAG
jgi:hypothetical protein